jgi:hypothetical protein
MAGFTGAAATNARSAVASRAIVADGNEKTQSRLLPSAARRRSFRSGSVPAVSPPALHFTARRTADRSCSFKNPTGLAPDIHKQIKIRRAKRKFTPDNLAPEPSQEASARG